MVLHSRGLQKIRLSPADFHYYPPQGYIRTSVCINFGVDKAELSLQSYLASSQNKLVIHHTPQRYVLMGAGPTYSAAAAGLAR